MGSFWIAVHIFDKPSDDCPCPPACILVRPCFPWGEREKKSCKHFAKKKWVLTFIRRNDARLPGIKDTDPRPLRVKAANVRAQFQCQWPGFARLLCRLVARTRNCMQNEPGHAHTQLRRRVVHGDMDFHFCLQNVSVRFFSVHLTYLMSKNHSMCRGRKLKLPQPFQNVMYVT